MQKNKTNLIDKIQAYFLIHGHALFSSLGRLVRNPISSAMTIVVLAIAITLASGFYLFIANVQQLTGSIESSNQISLFLKANVSDREGEILAERVMKDVRVGRVFVISKADALIEFKKYSGFGEALNALSNNPLPTVIQILPKNTLDDLQSTESLIEEYKKLPQVELVQLDMQWVLRLQSIMKVMQRGALIVGILLGFAVLLITGNTIRLELQNRIDEVQVAKLVGATHAFIQRPFLYIGFWLGFISALLAWIIITLIIFVLQSPVEELSHLYDEAFSVLYFQLTETLLLFAISSSLSVIGAWFVLHIQLQQIKPG